MLTDHHRSFHPHVKVATIEINGVNLIFWAFTLYESTGTRNTLKKKLNVHLSKIKNDTEMYTGNPDVLKSN